MKHLHSFARRAAAFLLAAVLCVCIPAAAASAATTIGGADTTLIPAEDENCLSWLFGSKDKITMPYLQSVESPYEEQYHKLLRRVIGKDYTYIEYNDSRTGEPYQSADTTHKDLGGFVQYNTLVSNGRSYRYINQFVSSRYCFDFGTDASGTPCMTYYGYGHGVGMSQCGAVGYAAEEGMNYKQILQHCYTGAKIRTSTTRSGGLFGWLAGLFR